MLLLSFDQRHDLAFSERRALAGGKGAGLSMMAAELGLPVPPGFSLTTRACHDYLQKGWSDPLEAALREGVAGIEAATGRRFGDERAPLLVSVRSGAPESMPGMLDTLLNVGLAESTQGGLAAYARPFMARDRAGRDVAAHDFARDCAERFEAAFEKVVGEAPPIDPWSQLRRGVEAVFRSVESPRVAAYRRRQGLSGELRTAVNVQAMVFGNLDDASASGVAFSRDPTTGEKRIYGDVLFRAQGEDVVAGRARPESIDRLRARLPDVAAALESALARLEIRLRDVCEVEFTVECGVLWLLQVRVAQRTDRAALRIAADLATEPHFPLDRRAAVARVAGILADPPRLVTPIEAAEERAVRTIGRGLGASPGIATGEVAVDIEAARARASAGSKIILVRPETSPEDVEGMALASGLLTARGGLASHAAVVARGWGLPAVVGLAELVIDERGFEIAGRRYGVGETISLDGTTGAVYEGALRVRESVQPELEPLRSWARELGIDLSTMRAEGVTQEAGAVARAAGSVQTERDAGRDDPPVDADAILRMLEIKGSATPEVLAFALVGHGEDPRVAAELETLASDELVAPTRPLGLGLTAKGRARAEALRRDDQSALGVEAALAALDVFQPLDARFKQAVTDWQLRDVAGELVPNDHADAIWDEAVVARLAALTEEVGGWLVDLARALPRLQGYRLRIDRALARLSDGDRRFVASPRVDSLHGVWFELHEDLIRLAGRSRAEEVASGRAG